MRLKNGAPISLDVLCSSLAGFSLQPPGHSHKTAYIIDLQLCYVRYQFPSTTTFRKRRRSWECA